MSVCDKFHEDNTGFKSQSFLWLNSKYKAPSVNPLKECCFLSKIKYHPRQAPNKIIAEACTISQTFLHNIVQVTLNLFLESFKQT